MLRWLLRLVSVMGIAFAIGVVWLCLRKEAVSNFEIYSFGHRPDSTISHDGRWLTEIQDGKLAFGLYAVDYPTINGGGGF